MNLLISKIRISWDLFFLTVFSFLTRFLYLGYPAKVVFDETHFGLYATKYLSHQYYFDIHPPLGKMLFGLFAFLGKIKPGFDFTIGSSYGDINFLFLRFLPALFGSLLVVLIYLLVRELGFSKRAAFLAGFLVLFDNAFLVQSRFILMDIILVFFIFLSLYLFILSRKYQPLSSQWYLFNILLALSIGAAISIKLTGFGLMGIIILFLIFTEEISFKTRKLMLARLSFILLAPLVIYFLIFASHFYLLSSPCHEKCGAVLDYYLEFDRPMKTGLSSFEIANSPPSGNIFSKFIETNKQMLSGNLEVDGFHYYQSDWYNWPFMMRPVKYFEESHGDKTSFIYFLGNPIVWWFALLGLISYLYLIIKNFILKFKLRLPESFYSKSMAILFIGYLFYFLSFASISRFMLIYHYLPALLFSIIIFSVCFDGILKILPSKKANFIFAGLLVVVFIGFLYFSPLSYGLPLTQEAFQLRMWLDTWAL